MKVPVDSANVCLITCLFVLDEHIYLAKMSFLSFTLHRNGDRRIKIKSNYGTCSKGLVNLQCEQKIKHLNFK